MAEGTLLSLGAFTEVRIMTATHPWLADFVDQLEQREAAVLIVGPGCAVTYATGAAERLLGASSGSVTGVTMDQLLPVERRGELKNFEDVLAGGSGRRLRSAVRLSDGRRIDVTLTLSPLVDTAGKVVAVSARYEPARSSAQWVRASLAPPRPSNPVAGASAPLESFRSPAYASAGSSQPRANGSRHSSNLGSNHGSLPAGPSGSLPAYVAPGFGPPPANGAPGFGPPPANGAPGFGPPPASEQRLAAANRPSSGIYARLGQLESHLRWLEDRLSSPPSLAPLDDPRERARALVVVGQARDLTAQCRQSLDDDDAQPIPAPPKLPRM